VLGGIVCGGLDSIAEEYQMMSLGGDRAMDEMMSLGSDREMDEVMSLGMRDRELSPAEGD
jgi:hypothetical protein